MSRDSRQSFGSRGVTSSGSNARARSPPEVDIAEQHEIDDDDDDEPPPPVVDRDPTGRYERYAQQLGKGAYKTVYRAFDQEEGVEVAWNQLRVDRLSNADAAKFKAEVAILESLRHPNVIKLYHSWSATNASGQETFYFITELMTSGTLRKYLRRTTARIRPKFFKAVAVQILRALDCLHSRGPPVIHRDLKGDNIFVNGNTAEIKIGDFGLATIKYLRHVESVLGTPEFMAPEMYDERYDEKVDIYAFGMCLIEMITKEYPYAECPSQVHIYRKVSAGVKPEALKKVDDPTLCQIIESCLEFNPERRPSTRDLLDHPYWRVSSDTPVLGPQVFSVSPEKDLCGMFQLLPAATSSTSLPDTARPSSSGNGGTDTESTSPPIGMTGSSTATIPGVNADSRKIAAVMSMDLRSVSADPRLRPIHPLTPASVPGPHRVLSHGPSTNPQPPSVHGNVEIVKREDGNTLSLKMTCRVPNTNKNQAVRFPFVLGSDTPEEVIAEMIREEVLEESDRELAVCNVRRLVERILSGEHVEPSTARSAPPIAPTSPKKNARGSAQIVPPGTERSIANETAGLMMSHHEPRLSSEFGHHEQSLPARSLASEIAAIVANGHRLSSNGLNHHGRSSSHHHTVDDSVPPDSITHCSSAISPNERSFSPHSVCSSEDYFPTLVQPTELAQTVETVEDVMVRLARSNTLKAPVPPINVASKEGQAPCKESHVSLAVIALHGSKAEQPAEFGSRPPTRTNSGSENTPTGDPLLSPAFSTKMLLPPGATSPDAHSEAAYPLGDVKEAELLSVLEDDPYLMDLWVKQQREAEEMSRSHRAEWNLRISRAKARRGSEDAGA